MGRRGAIAVQRMNILDHLAVPAFDSMMIACGYYRHKRTWRRRGVVTMRGIGAAGVGRLGEIVERERARRFFSSVEDQAAELAKYKDISEAALDELVRLITSSPFEQEAHVRRVARAATALAGGVTEPATLEVARLVAILRLECSYVDSLYFRMVRDGGLGTPVSREVAVWRDRSGRRLESMIRTLAYMKHCAFSDVEASVRRLRLAAG
jgi:hypothetical protein